MTRPLIVSPSPILDTIAQWQGRQPWEFPSAAPPPPLLALGNSSADRILAAVFQSVAQEPDEGRRSIHVSKIALIHTHRLSGALNARPDRREELRPYWDMIQILAAWNSAILDARASA